MKTEAAAVVLPPTFVPLPGLNLAPTDMPPFTFAPTFEQYQTILERGFGPFFARSVIAVVGSTILVLVLGVPCAYALAFRMIEGWRDSLFFFISTKFLPPVGIIVPIYIIMNNLQLLDNILVAVAQDHGVAVLPCSILHAPSNRREERVTDIGDDQPERMRALEREHPGGGVRVVLELVHGRQDPIAQVIRDEPRSIQHVRYRAGGDSGSAGDVADGYHRGSLHRAEG